MVRIWTEDQGAVKPLRVRCEESEWIGANRHWLYKEHPGEWIAVEGSALIAAGKDLAKVLAEARRKGIEHPLLDCIPRKEYQRGLIIRTPRIER